MRPGNTARWMQQHSSYNRDDPNHLLTRQDWVTVLRLIAGQKNLSNHQSTKLCICHVEQFPLQYWQSDCCIPTSSLEMTLARPLPSGLQAVQQSGEPTACCYIDCGDWNLHLMNEEKKMMTELKLRLAGCVQVIAPKLRAVLPTTCLVVFLCKCSTF